MGLLTNQTEMRKFRRRGSSCAVTGPAPHGHTPLASRIVHLCPRIQLSWAVIDVWAKRFHMTFSSFSQFATCFPGGTFNSPSREYCLFPCAYYYHVVLTGILFASCKGSGSLSPIGGDEKRQEDTLVSVLQHAHFRRNPGYSMFVQNGGFRNKH